MNKIPIIVVAGPTASGKTSLGVELCKIFGGEVISADSMQIYKGMDIATAKPTKEEMQGIKHYLIDILDPAQSFSVADFKEYAEKAISEITEKNKIPVIVGGTGLYIDSLIENLTLSEASTDETVRAKLFERAEKEGAEVLLAELNEIDSEYARKLHKNNVKRIVRALELWETAHITMTEQIKNSKAVEPPYKVCYICLDADNREVLYKRINKRVDLMLEAGLIEETEKYFSSCGKTSAQAIGYKELAPYLNGEKTLEQAVEALKQGTRRYAKRQLTWFRRNENAVHLYIDRYETKQELIKAAAEIVKNSKILEE